VGIIFDTCIWLGLDADELDPQSVAAAAGDAPVFISVISLGELGFGVESCSDPSQRAIRASRLKRLEHRPALDISRSTAAAFAVLAASIKQAGRSPRPRYNDLWIAAQAIENGFSLLTTNIKDFANLPGLRLLNP
jgi:predicted nucleic acid-binding protein